MKYNKLETPIIRKLNIANESDEKDYSLRQVLCICDKLVQVTLYVRINRQNHLNFLKNVIHHIMVLLVFIPKERTYVP